MAETGSMRILVVEDEVLIAVMVSDMLAGLGATVVGPATTIEAGLALARSESFDAAVLDINVRGTSFFGKGGPDVALVSAAELSIAF